MLSIIIYKVLCFFFADLNYGSLLVIIIIIVVRVILSFLTLTPDYVFLNLEVSNHVICSNDALIIILNEETGEATVIYSDIKDRDFEDIKIIGGSADNISNVAIKQNSVPHLIDYTRFTQSLNNLRNIIKKEKPSTSVVRKILYMNWRDVGK